MGGGSGGPVREEAGHGRGEGEAGGDADHGGWRAVVGVGGRARGLSAWKVFAARRKSQRVEGDRPHGVWER